MVRLQRLNIQSDFIFVSEGKETVMGGVREKSVPYLLVDL